MEKGSIGGQAIIEGVMMKSRKTFSTAVRTPDNDIVVKVWDNYKPAEQRNKFWKLPFTRGIYTFVEALYLGVKTLTYSSDISEGITEDKKKEKSDELMMYVAVCFSVVLAIALFLLLPAFLGSLFDKIIDSSLLVSFIEGIIRMIIFLGYVILISQMEDIKRTFMYHGAEHKAINCFEKNIPLTPENVMAQTRKNKRCGTSFLIFVMIVSIILFMFITAEAMWLKLLLRLLLIPVISGISFEIIRFGGIHDSKFADLTSKPGVWLQIITTREPTPDMVEVAIAAINAVVEATEGKQSDMTDDGEIEVVGDNRIDA